MNPADYALTSHLYHSFSRAGSRRDPGFAARERASGGGGPVGHFMIDYDGVGGQWPTMPDLAQFADCAILL